MNIQEEMCCLCLKTNITYCHLNDSSWDNITYYDKISTALPKLYFENKNDDYYICSECCDIIDSTYEFTFKCIKNLNTFKEYKAQLRIKYSKNSQSININNKPNEETNIVYINDTHKKNKHKSHEPTSTKSPLNSTDSFNQIRNFKIEEINIKVEETDDNDFFNEDDMTLDDTKELVAEETAAFSIQSLIPEKSKDKYESAYQQFENWYKEKDEKVINEKILLEYFEEKSTVVKSPTLWSLYSMLRATLSVKKEIDIKKFVSLIDFIKKKSKGYQSMKSRILTKHEIEYFLKEADDATYLMMKVVLIIGISGACQRDELTYLKLEHIKDMGSFIFIDIPNARKIGRKQFSINSGTMEGLDLVEIFRKYSSLRPKSINTSRFFLGYRSGKCSKQVAGINSIGSVPKKIAEFLKLPNPLSYTAHCFKRSAAMLMASPRNIW